MEPKAWLMDPILLKPWKTLKLRPRGTLEIKSGFNEKDFPPIERTFPSGPLCVNENALGVPCPETIPVSGRT